MHVFQEAGGHCGCLADGDSVSATRGPHEFERRLDMRKLNLLAAVAATLLVGGTAVAKDSKAEGAPKVKKICRGDPDSTTRIPKKICRTKAEWEQATARGELDSATGRLGAISRGN
jgi:hypothetical protein